MPSSSFDPDAEYASLNRDAVGRIDSMLPEALKGMGVSVPKPGGGAMLLTPPLPVDIEEAPGAFLRITGLDADGQPQGHTVVTRDQYRDFRQTANPHRTPGRLLDLFLAVRDELRPDLTRGIMGVTLGEPTDYLYQLRYREHAPGTSPEEGLVSASGRELVFSRPLSSEELRRFEAKPVGARPAGLRPLPSPQGPAPVVEPQR